MRLTLPMFRSRDPGATAEPEQSSSRLDKVVGRQRQLAADERLGRLSRQSSDEVEDLSTPLYDSAAYGGSNPLDD